MERPLDDETLQRLYAWIDEIPLSRPKKNISRDFSDGILLAEVIAYYFPKLVQMHNYSPANSVKQKQYNWTTLNRKVLKRLNLYLTKEDVDDLVLCRSGAVEHLLIANYKEKRPSSSNLRDVFNEQDDDEHVASPMSTGSSVASFAPSNRPSIHSPAVEKQILEMKVQKLEQLVRLKDGKIQTLVAKLRSQKPQ
ncbi:hypothetical protein Poli38472_002226 [Pythium oligandrum]|uniref:Calponin-homology (CH) domain-containing protein n=1 Tax=Pythium oligandrum TaxID=41045 RepID=A0A8K1FGY0_PYTOL|nr:hypothetical protein Poli38472_002226 [Pythium oligandrum]|eukprot:TMW63285.1 hypothetical protein Poli38472_002226 [Pythium oligandrum]